MVRVGRPASDSDLLNRVARSQRIVEAGPIRNLHGKELVGFAN